MGIFVETLVRAPMEALWAHTQKPELHERWDLRLSHIEYLPRQTEADPQCFRYVTRIGFGVVVSGKGESVGETDGENGSRSSALKFGSDDPRSIIREGSGYWKYIPTTTGIRFLTWYDYRTRFGAIGAAWDRFVFRPLMGWATAWSFDRLRLWLDEGIDPAHAMRLTVVHGITRIGMAAIFAYHGIVPKLLGPHADEVAMLRDLGVAANRIGVTVAALGIAELVLALALLVGWLRRWPIFVSLGLMLMATVGVILNSPRYISAAFNPISLNLAVACLAVVDLVVMRGVPSAARCLRRPLRETA